MRRAIQTGVAGNRLLLRFWQFHLGSDDHGAARKALADVVVGLAVEGYLDSPGQECPEALTGRAAKLEPNGLPRPGDLASFHGSCQTGAEGSVGGRDPQDAFGWALAARQRRRKLGFNLGGGPSGDQSARRSRVLTTRGSSIPLRAFDQRPQPLPCPGERRLEPPRLPDNLAHGPCSDRPELPSEILCQRPGEPFDLLGGARELGAQVGALCGDTGRTRIEMALAGHVAAKGDECGRAEAELLRSQ